MEATYIPSSFYEENDKHQRSIRALKNYYKGVKVITELPEKNNEGYDLLIATGDSVCRVEVKTNRGSTVGGRCYPTWILETYTDYNQEKLPEWRTAPKLDNLIIFNLTAKVAFIYDISTLRDYVTTNEHDHVPSGTGTGQYNKTGKKLCSWGLKIGWECKEAGHIKTIDLARYL